MRGFLRGYARPPHYSIMYVASPWWYPSRPAPMLENRLHVRNAMDHSRPPRTRRRRLHRVLLRHDAMVRRPRSRVPGCARRARGGVSPQSRPSPHSGASRCVPSAHGTPRMKRLSAGVCRGTLTAMPVLDCASRRKKKACRQPVHDDRVVHGETRSATHLKVGNTPEGSHLRTARAHTASSVNGWWQALCRWMVRQPLLFCALHHKQGHGFRHHR